EILGVNQSASALARIIGPMVGVSLFFATPSHILPYLLGAGLLVFVFVLSLSLRQEARRGGGGRPPRPPSGGGRPRARRPGRPGANARLCATTRPSASP